MIRSTWYKAKNSRGRGSGDRYSFTARNKIIIYVLCYWSIFYFHFCFQDGFNVSTRINNITMLTNLQAYAQLAQINITVLTNLQTCTINTNGAEFYQLKHLQATGKKVPLLPLKVGILPGPGSGAPGPTQVPPPSRLSVSVWKISPTHSASDPRKLHLPAEATGSLPWPPPPSLWWSNSCVSVLLPGG